MERSSTNADLEAAQGAVTHTTEAPASTESSPHFVGDKAEVLSEKHEDNSTGTSLLVSWDSDDDPLIPYNWPLYIRAWMLVLISCTGLVTLMASSMLAPALPYIAQDLRLSQDTAQIVLSIYVLAYAFGPLVLGPLSEVYGRRIVWILCGLWFIVWNAVCGVSDNRGLIIVSRLFAGFGGSVIFVLASPVAADLFRPENRGTSFAIVTFVPLLGPAIGPIIGGFITQYLSWHWMFYVTSIFYAAIVLIGLFVFYETYKPLALAAKAKKLRKSTGLDYRTAHELNPPPTRQRLSAALTRPVRMLLFQPTIQFMCLLLAYNFGVLYVVLSTLSAIFTDVYGQSASDAGLQYISMAIGNTIAAQVGAPLTDRIWKYLQRRAGGKTAPEYRVPLMVPGTILLPIGLLWYGWSTETRTHWIITDLGVVVFSCGVIVATQAMQSYVMDCYRDHTASATASSQLLRSICGFAFPIFSPALYQRLGYGWGNTVLALVFLALAMPAPFILWKYGERLRNMKKWIE